ncbi:MAG: TldD/PmbA family protein [Firmicutes bacterium]|nr:TldD/PmbA family protein [Bacillota bacterium]
MLNSRGLSGHYRRTGYSHSAGGRLVEGQNFLHVGEAHQSARQEDVSPALVEAIRWSFEKARNNVPLVSGKYQVILTPRATAAVLGPVLASLNGQALERGVSPFVAKQGQTLFDPRISLEDDALLPWGPGSRAMDDEGVPARRKPLVERGTIRNFFLDLATAQALGEEPNGSARRTAGIPAPGPTNLLMLPGQRSYGEMIGSLGQGFLIDMLMGAWAGNPYGGSVSGNVMLGYKIEDGQVVGRIKDTMCSVNAFQALKEQVVELSRERKWESAGGPNAPGGSLYLPYLWLDGVSISTRQG